MNSKKTTFLVLCILTLLFTSFMGERYAYAASIPYDSYIYDYRGYIVRTPAPYVPKKNISGISLGVGKFTNPQDMCVAPDGKIYVADTGNNRIVVLSEDALNVVKEIKGFTRDGKEETFKQPYGVCVSQSNVLYVADTENKRIIALDENGEFVKCIENPTSDVLEEGFVFTPLKVTVDYADRVYCIAKGVFEGIMVFEENGQFSSFFGTINVEISTWEKFWRWLSTKEERSRQTLYIPTEFTGVDVDDDGFIYASNIDTTGVQAARRLNPRGQDVIKKGTEKNVGGDLVTGGASTYSGPSYIVDIVYRNDGIYSILDSKRGRIFTYDHEGNMLYIFGGLGSQAGTFTSPVAIEESGDRIFVLDATRAEILTFEATEYGSLINEAVRLRYSGDESQAVGVWEKVLDFNENFELANVGIGKAYLTAGDNKSAMKYLKLGMSRDYYSIAFKRYRNEILKDNLGYILTGIVVLIAALKIGSIVKRRKGGVKE